MEKNDRPEKIICIDISSTQTSQTSEESELSLSKNQGVDQNNDSFKSHSKQQMAKKEPRTFQRPINLSNEIPVLHITPRDADADLILKVTAGHSNRSAIIPTYKEDMV